jgi:hypothetical protein
LPASLFLPRQASCFFQNPFAQYQPNHIGNRIDYSAVKPNQLALAAAVSGSRDPLSNPLLLQKSKVSESSISFRQILAYIILKPKNLS